ncbi:P-loop NTPase fold protein [Sporosarcina ureae]|uniref:P-loop NTPase fold protein n=1 Tax=Sporosarcina ureae TaxID=1571 RepID=UPI0009DC4EA4|nr:P-loop NTPase fold protein [Sporosarcina ureae]ARF16394.1 hypothetical protein SporoP17a_03160 [Sporosarcina ureae]
MYRGLINLLMASIVIVFVIVSTIEIKWIIYFAIFCTQLILIKVNLSIAKNKMYLKKIFVVNITFFIIFCINEKRLNNIVFESGLEAFYFLIIACFHIITIFYFLLDYLEIKPTEDDGGKIIMKREQDLKQLEYYIDTFQIVGLNGRWGTGKTFLLSELKKRLSNSYEFIEVDLLVSNLNEMQLTLIKSFEELLYNRRIIPEYANKLKKDVSSASFLTEIQSILNLVFKNSDSQAETLKAFMKETKKLDKKVLIIYEDMDRIENKEVVKEIFAISEKIASTNIRVIYQYDEKLLVGQGFKYDYLEKYIPFKMSLTELHFIEIIDFELKDKYKEILSIEDFKYLQLQEFRFNLLTEHFGYSGEYIAEIEYIPIRKVQNMLAELYFVLAKKRDLIEKHKELIISFHILKHFIPDQYEKLNIKQNFFEAMGFRFEGKYYTILELMSLDINDETLSLLDKIFQIEENREVYGILKLFNFELISNRSIKDVKRYEELKRTSKYKNDKMDRIIWKLLYEGKSVFTDYENAVKKMCEEVLDIHESEEQKIAFRNYKINFFHTNQMISDNSTIFKMGMNSFENIFEAFKVVQVSEEYRIKLNEFYFKYRNTIEIDISLIKCLNYLPLNSDKQYIQVIKYFNQLHPITNFNTSKDFFYFIQKYIKGLAQVKLFNSYDYYWNREIEEPYNFQKEIAFNKERLDHLITEVKRTIELYEDLSLNALVLILKEVETFIKKLLEIIEIPVEFQSESGPSISTEITSRYPNQEEYDRLKDLISTDLELEAFKEELVDSYKNNNISLYEITRLVKENKDFLI